MTAMLKTEGALDERHLYVERDADRRLREALLGGEFCYVLAPRQVGKSSLWHRTAGWLKTQGVTCIYLELGGIVITHDSLANFYYSMAVQIGRALSLEEPPELLQAIRRSPKVAWTQFMLDVLQARPDSPIVICLDEIENTLLVADRNTFFAGIRAIYNQRANEPILRRLSFCILGGVPASELMTDPRQTPFNIGSRISLDDFTRSELEAFAPRLPQELGPPARWLDAVFDWTHGHPYMVQTLVAALTSSPASDSVADVVKEIVRHRFLDFGRVDDANLSYVERQFTDNSTAYRAGGMLRLYRRVRKGRLVARADDPTEEHLYMTGLVARRLDGTGGQTVLCVRSRIFSEVFDEKWIEGKLARRMIAPPLHRWLESGRQVGNLLRGRTLDEAFQWYSEHEDLTQEEAQFILASMKIERRRRRLWNYAVLMTVTLAIGAGGWVWWLARQTDRLRAQEASTARFVRAEAAAGRRNTAVDAALRLAIARVDSNVNATNTLTEALGSPEHLQRVPAPPGRITALAASPDGHLIAIGTSGGTYLWDAVDPNGIWMLPLRDSKADTSPIAIAAAFSSDGRWLAVSSTGATRLWDVSECTRARTTEKPFCDAARILFPYAVSALAFSADGTRLATGGGDGADFLEVVALEHGVSVRASESVWSENAPARPVRTRKGIRSKGGVVALAFSTDQRWLLVAEQTGLYRIQIIDGLLDASSKIDLVALEQVKTAAFASRGTRVLLGRENKETLLIELDRSGGDGRTLARRGAVGDPPAPLALDSTMTGIINPGFAALSGDGCVMVTAGEKSADVWRIHPEWAAGIFSVEVESGEGSPDVTNEGQMVLTPDGRDVVIALSEGGIYAHSLTDRRHTGTRLSKEPADYSCIGFSEDGRWMVARDAAGKIHLWKDRQPHIVLDAEPSATPACPVLATDGDTFVRVAMIADLQRPTVAGKRIVLWDGITGKRVSLPWNPLVPIYALALVDRGRTIVTGDEGGLVMFRDESGPTNRRAIKAFNSAISAVSVAPGGAFLGVMADAATHITVFALHNGDPVGGLDETGEVRSFSVAPDGRQVLTSSPWVHWWKWSDDRNQFVLQSQFAIESEHTASLSYAHGVPAAVTLVQDGLRLWLFGRTPLVAAGCRAVDVKPEGNSPSLEEIELKRTCDEKQDIVDLLSIFR